MKQIQNFPPCPSWASAIRVSKTVCSSPASFPTRRPAAANLQPNDIVTAVNGNAIQVETVRQLVWIYDVGTSIELSLLRDGEAMQQSLTLMARPDDVFKQPRLSHAAGLGEHRSLRWAVRRPSCWSSALYAGSQVAEAGFYLYDEIVEN